MHPVENTVQQRIAECGVHYGGGWTVEKLYVLGNYLDRYTTALKNQPFRLMYIDAFAGTGRVELGQDETDFVHGSAMRALLVVDRPFDRLAYVETNPTHFKELEKLQEIHFDRDIRIRNMDANLFLRDLSEDWTKWRGVLFLDPFATQVAWSTIERIAGFRALDTWIMFPVSAVSRILPTSKRPDDIARGWVDRLATVYGDDGWRELYRETRQLSLFGEIEHERDPGVDGLVEIYKRKLSALFGDRFLSETRTLQNSKGSPLFVMMFCVGSDNPKAIRLAKRIARHIVENI